METKLVVISMLQCIQKSKYNFVRLNLKCYKPILYQSISEKVVCQTTNLTEQTSETIQDKENRTIQKLVWNNQSNDNSRQQQETLRWEKNLVFPEPPHYNIQSVSFSYQQTEFNSTLKGLIHHDQVGLINPWDARWGQHTKINKSVWPTRTYSVAQETLLNILW